jgi:4-oxalocrotonate tautomerase
MPHIIVKMLSGRIEKQKQQLAEVVTKVVMKIKGNNADAVSVAAENIEQKDWTEKVYNADIKNNWDKLYKKPGYKPV